MKKLVEETGMSFVYMLIGSSITATLAVAIHTICSY